MAGGNMWPLPALWHSALVGGGLLVYVLGTRIGQQRRPPSAAIAWILLMLLSPYLGIPLFLVFGRRKLLRSSSAAQGRLLQDHACPGPAWATELLAALAVPPATNNLAVHFHEDGSASLQALLDLVEQARQHIDLCTFILAADAVGDALVSALVRRAQDGVQVRVMLDLFGYCRCARAHVRSMREAGIMVRWFMLPQPGRRVAGVNLRNHRKLLLCDDMRLWSGGRNFSVEYFIDVSRRAAWTDLSFVIDGALAAQAAVLFDRDWEVAGGAARLAAPTSAPRSHRVPAQLVPSGPDYADDTVYALLLTAAYRARRRIVAITPYFVPDEGLLAAWRMACRRGVRLTILVPARSNHRLADWARESALRDLARAGAEVYLYPAMMHAKAVLVDDDLALCGTANLDGRSLFINFELMTAFYGRHEIAWLAGWIMRRLRQSSRYVPRQRRWWRDLIEGLVRVIGFQL